MNLSKTLMVILRELRSEMHIFLMQLGEAYQRHFQGACVRFSGCTLDCQQIRAQQEYCSGHYCLKIERVSTSVTRSLQREDDACGAKISLSTMYGGTLS